jgi:hypothetical protein
MVNFPEATLRFTEVVRLIRLVPCYCIVLIMIKGPVCYRKGITFDKIRYGRKVNFKKKALLSYLN